MYVHARPRFPHRIPLKDAITKRHVTIVSHHWLTPAAASVGFHGRPSTQRNLHLVLSEVFVSSQLVTSRLTSCIKDPRLSKLFCIPPPYTRAG